MKGPRGIHHVAVAVPEVGTAIERFRALGFEVGSREVVESFATEAVMLPVGESAIELIAPLGDGPLERFLERKGRGLHHIAVEVDELEAMLAELRAAGIELVEDAPERGIHGRRVAFVHPRATGGVSIELIEATPSPESPKG